MADGFVLIVDDNPDTLSLLAKALELEGIRVRTATSVFKALESLHDGSPRPAVIITDLLMPQTSGWDFLKHLRGEAALKTLPVIVVTGADPNDGETMADMVLRKPVDTGQLAESVRAMLAAGQAER